MSGGANANMGWSSYLCVGREKAFKTYDTCTAGLDFINAKFKTVKSSKVIEAVRASRTFIDRVALGKVVSGEIDFAMAADSNAAQYLLQNAMGGGVITTATAAGDTTGAGVFEHVYAVNSFDVTYSSLCLNHRKGDSTNGQIFEYSGFRVDEFTLKAQVDDVLMAHASLVGVDSTATSNNVSGNLTLAGQTPLSFEGMRFSVENSFNSLTASTYWHVQSFEFGIKNNIKADSDSRRIGTDLIEVLPPGAVNHTLKCKMRFDDMVAFNAMKNQTSLAVQIDCLGATITGSKFPYMVRFDLPRVYIEDAGDPEVGGPDNILTAEVVFQILQDDSTTTGYACKATVRNSTSTYA